MKKFFLIGAALAALTTGAQAFTPIGAVDTTVVMFPAAPSAEQLANHKLYVQNLKDAGLYTTASANWVVNTSAAMFPDHSKVARTGPYGGAVGGRRDPSMGF